MDKIAKFLKKLTSKELVLALDLLEKIKKGEFTGLNIKKLKGYENIFRVRNGSMRILYSLDAQDNYHIINIERRDEQTYKL